MLAGVYLAKKKDGTVYYRSNITFQNKHISLGSFPTEQLAHQAYEEAGQILNADITPGDYSINTFVLSFDKIISLMNFRDNHIYILTILLIICHRQRNLNLILTICFFIPVIGF